MRKQYHLWPSADGDGLDAWDVDRLIELGAERPVEQLTVAEVDEVDTAYWSAPGQELTVRKVVTHMRLTLAVDPAFPVVIGPDGRVCDGMHRIARALLDGRATVPAVRLAAMPPPTFRHVHHVGELPYDRAPGDPWADA